MLKARTLKVLALILSAYGLLWALAAVVPSFQDSPIGLLPIAPLLLTYLLHKAGVPGLLEHNGLCGWGWCSPTVFGWAFSLVILLLGGWLLAWAAASLTGRLSARQAQRQGQKQFRPNKPSKPNRFAGGLILVLGAMDRTIIIAWLKASLLIVGAFFASGIFAGWGAGVLHLWDTPIAGCVAAFSVVLTAYLTAPAHRIWAACLTFAAGAIVAWHFIGNSVYPESYGSMGYQPTHLPFLSTLSGGLAALALAFALRRRHGSRELGA